MFNDGGTPPLLTAAASPAACLARRVVVAAGLPPAPPPARAPRGATGVPAPRRRAGLPRRLRGALRVAGLAPRPRPGRPPRGRRPRRHDRTGATCARARRGDGDRHGVRAPTFPTCRGERAFAGVQLHSSAYRSAEAFAGRRVLVVGGANSGGPRSWPRSRRSPTRCGPRSARPDSCRRTWTGACCSTRPRRATTRCRTASRPTAPTVWATWCRCRRCGPRARPGGWGRCVRPSPGSPPTGAVWPDGREEPFDAVIWCTGFAPALGALAPLGVLDADGRVAVEGTRAPRGAPAVAGRLRLVDGLCLGDAGRGGPLGAGRRRARSPPRSPDGLAAPRWRGPSASGSVQLVDPREAASAASPRPTGCASSSNAASPSSISPSASRRRNDRNSRSHTDRKAE